MTIQPIQAFLLVRIKDAAPPKNSLVLPEKSDPLLPYGEVISVGPDCEFCVVGDNVLFLPQNMVMGFDQGKDEKFLIPESCVLGKYLKDSADDVLSLNKRN